MWSGLPQRHSAYPPGPATFPGGAFIRDRGGALILIGQPCGLDKLDLWHYTLQNTTGWDGVDQDLKPLSKGQSPSVPGAAELAIPMNGLDSNFQDMAFS
jgi:hypothetical protein